MLMITRPKSNQVITNIGNLIGSSGGDGNKVNKSEKNKSVKKKIN